MSQLITRYRGDTYPIKYKMRTGVGGTAVDITGCTFLMSINSLENPTSDATQIMQLVGTVTSALNGEIEFPFTTNQANVPPGTYHYDIQMTDAAGKIRTVRKSVIQWSQDITK